MGKLSKWADSRELEFFAKPYTVWDSSDVSKYTVWAYGSLSGSDTNHEFMRVSKSVILNTGSWDLVTLIPKRYRGKRLSRREVQFLLNVREKWGEKYVSSYEHIDSLLAMHRSLTRFYRKQAARKAILGWVLASGGLAVFASLLSGLATGIFFSANSIPIFGIGAGVVLPVIASFELEGFFTQRKSMSSIEIEHVLLKADSQHVHSDFFEYYNYLHKEWSSLTSEVKKRIYAEHPIPSMLNVYRAGYHSLRGLSVTGRIGLTEHVGRTGFAGSGISKDWVQSKKTLAEERKAILREVRERSRSRPDRNIKIGGSIPAIAIEPAPAVHAESGSWDSALLIFENVKKEWSDWEMDVLKVVQYPALFDMRENTTVKFHRALIFAESKKPQMTQQYSELHPFSHAVTELQLAWTVAKSEAERIQQSHFNEEERIRLSRALDLLNLALNASGTPAERQASYKRAMKQLEGLVRVPDAARLEIESGVSWGVLEES